MPIPTQEEFQKRAAQTLEHIANHPPFTSPVQSVQGAIGEDHAAFLRVQAEIQRLVQENLDLKNQLRVRADAAKCDNDQVDRLMARIGRIENLLGFCTTTLLTDTQRKTFLDHLLKALGDT